MVTTGGGTGAAGQRVAGQAAILLMLLATLGGTAGCATTRAGVPAAGAARANGAAPDDWRARPFPEGERLVYRSRVAGIDAARATLSVGKQLPLQDRPALPLRVTVEGYEWLTRFYPLKIKFISFVEPETLLPRRVEREGTNGSVGRQVTLQYQPKGRVQVDLTLDGKKPRHYRRLTLPGAYDLVSAVYDIRAWLMTGEATRELTVFDGAWTRKVKVTRGRVEEVWTPAGWFKARRFEVVAERVKVPGDRSAPKWEPRTEQFSAWVTDDDQLVPVRLLAETPVGPAEVLLESRTTRSDPAEPTAGPGDRDEGRASGATLASDGALQASDGDRR